MKLTIIKPDGSATLQVIEIPDGMEKDEEYMALLVPAGHSWAQLPEDILVERPVFGAPVAEHLNQTPPRVWPDGRPMTQEELYGSQA